MKIPPSTPGLAAKASPHSRFIPREELSHFEAWAPGALSDTGAPRAPSEGGVRSGAAPDPLHAARQAGYQEGYRDGLAALEGFKQSFATNTAAQVGALLQSVGSQLDALQQAMANAVVQAATQLARQIVQSELAARPELIAGVAEQALDALMLSARHLTLRLHPDDQRLVAQGAADVLAARGARLIGDPTLQRGGCLIESDLGRIDATIATRWKRAVATIGSEHAWNSQAQSAEAAAPGIDAMASSNGNSSADAGSRANSNPDRPSPDTPTAAPEDLT